MSALKRRDEILKCDFSHKNSTFYSDMKTAHLSNKVFVEKAACQLLAIQPKRRENQVHMG